MGRPHIADALVAAGHVRDRKEAFDRFLADGGPAHVPRYAIEIGRGIDLVHARRRGRRDRPPLGPRPGGRAAAGGAAGSWSPSTGLDGIEVDHQDHDADDPGRLRALADELGVLITGSSDYHGTGQDRPRSRRATPPTRRCTPGC